MRNRKYYNLFADFSSLHKYHIKPGDLDMYFICEDHYLVLGEAKLQGSHMKGVQEKALTTLIDEHESGGILFEIEHNSRVQDGATSYDIGDCLVRRAYKKGKTDEKGKWYDFKPMKFLNIATKISNDHGGMIRV